jgi:repressor of nif and glnA expression
MTDVSERLTAEILNVLRAADEPLSAGRIQRRMASDGYDATTGAVRDACRRLADEGVVASTDDPPAYRLVD